ncbi:MAG TPA: MBOAT family protein [Verrucomicrobiae bacterium]
MTIQPSTVAMFRRWLGPVLAVAIGAVLVAAWHRQAWVFMWALAFAIFAGFKWLTYREALAGGLAVPRIARFVYLLCWPGMSLKEFAKTTPSKQRTNSIPHWMAAAAKTLIGAGLVWFAVPRIPADAWLLRGWMGMVGIIMMLHFGLFHLLALALRACGFDARPNMRAPLLARSLADFWGNRWNTAFNVLAARYGFRLLTPRIGPRAALGVVFLASGLLHEAVVTLPARGGYGLPTTYFALQAGGIFLERLPLFRRRPWLKRLFAWVVLIVPLGWLFPPVFVRNVMLPMLHAIGATGNMP